MFVGQAGNASPEAVHRFSAHASPTMKICISQSGEFILARTWNNEITMWKKNGPRFDQVAKVQMDSKLQDFGFRDNEAILAHQDKEGGVQFYKLAENKLQKDQQIAPNKDGNELHDKPWVHFFAGAKLIALWYPDGAREFRDFPLRKQTPRLRLGPDDYSSTSIAIAGDMSKVAVVTLENVLQVWEMNTGKNDVTQKFPEFAGPFLGAVFSKDRNRLTIGYGTYAGWEWNFRVCDLRNGERVDFGFSYIERKTEHGANGAKVKGLVFADDGETAYTCDNFGLVFSYSLTSRIRTLIHKADDGFHSIAISPQEDYLAVGGWSGSISIIPINIEKRKRIR
jgi:WD40 repeat protein